MTTKEIEIDVPTIVNAKQRHLDLRQEKTPSEAVIALADMQQRPKPVLNIVTGGNHVTLIGQIRYTEMYDPVAAALRYVRNGVDSVSLFTDKNIYTKGMDDMLLVSRGVQRTPVICQDYILTEYHVAEARAAGASAIMLYSAILDYVQLRRLVSITQRWRMTAIVQVSTEDDLAVAAELSPHVIAIGDDLFFNRQRDLPLFELLHKHLPFNTRVMPAGCLKTLEDVSAVVEHGTDAVIVDGDIIKQPQEYEQLRLLLEFHNAW